jgi:hypothetical protein
MILLLLPVEEWRHRLLFICLLIGTMGCGLMKSKYIVLTTTALAIGFSAW